MLPVRTGEVYAETGKRRALWQVVQVITPPSGLVHVRLRERAGEQRRLLLSCRELGERFRPHVVAIPRAPARSPVPFVRDGEAAREVA